MIFGRSTEIAIAAMSRLAELYETDKASMTSADIAESRCVPKPYVAKVLTILAQRGLVAGTQGRKGGYGLARPPGKITLLEIAACFERDLKPIACPFGPGYCGDKAPCPLHNDIAALHRQAYSFLENTTLAVFCARNAQEIASRPNRRAR